MVQFSPNNPYHAQTSMPNTSFNYVQNLPKNSPTVIINEEEQKALKEQKDQILKFALIPPVYFSVKKGVDLFQNACMGDYEKSLPYKLSNFGDKIANSSLVNSRFSNSIKTGLRNFKQKINNFINNSQILSTIKEMPANPENKNVIGFLKNQEAETASEFATCAKEFFVKFKILFSCDNRSIPSLFIPVLTAICIFNFILFFIAYSICLVSLIATDKLYLDTMVKSLFFTGNKTRIGFVIPLIRRQIPSSKKDTA